MVGLCVRSCMLVHDCVPDVLGGQKRATGVIYSCELLCGGWELNLHPLEEQPMLLTVKTVSPALGLQCLLKCD